jgi:aspartate kinase
VRLPGERPNLVLRFGGSSLISVLRIRNAANRIGWHVTAGSRVAAVVSAPAHRTERIVRWIERLGAADVPGVARELDRAEAGADYLTAGLLAAAVAALGRPAVSLGAEDLRLTGVGEFGAGVVTSLDCHRVLRLLVEGIVPVACGGHLKRSDGETVAVAPRGADLSAVLLADAIGAECHFVVDRDRMDPTGELIHPVALNRAAAVGVPVQVYSFRSPVGGRERGNTC